MTDTAALRPLAPARPSDQPAPRRLAAVAPAPRRRVRPRTHYALVAVGAAAAVIVVQLLLSVAVTSGAFRLVDLTNAKAALDRSSQETSEDLQRLESPQNLAANASALGMVTDGSPVYLRLSDGSVSGTPAPATPQAATGAGANLVPNSKLAGLPLVTTKGAEPAPASGPAVSADGESASATPSGAADAGAGSPVPWTGVLPSPTTR